MSKSSRLALEVQDRLYQQGIDVDDPNDLRGTERMELDEWIDMVNELLAEAKTKDSINEIGESNESTKERNH